MAALGHIKNGHTMWLTRGVYDVVSYLSDKQLGARMQAHTTEDGIVLECLNVIPKYWSAVMLPECRRLAKKYDFHLSGQWKKSYYSKNFRRVLHVCVAVFADVRLHYPLCVGDNLIPSLVSLNVLWDKERKQHEQVYNCVGKRFN